MKEFDISDKELKSLLKQDGIESPSMNFNEQLMAKIEVHEKLKAKPVTAPKWLIIILAICFIAPAVYYIFSGQIDLSQSTGSGFTLPKLNLNPGNQVSLYSLMAMAVSVMTLIFDSQLRKQADRGPVKKG